MTTNTICSVTAWRLDVQRLRGIAVLAVVVYHSQLGLSGGFSGVDVFFVISGYVIAGSLRRDIEKRGTLSIRHFYERRIRRLAPNYLLLVAVTLAVSHFFFDPYTELPRIKWAALTSIFASTNLYFLATDRYDALIENPLRHLWSLGVEEHFYFILPWLYLIVTQQRRPQWLTIRHLILLFGGISLAGSMCLVYFARAGAFGWSRDDVLRFNFFGSPLRFWEILAGVLIAHTSPVFMTGMSRRIVRLSALTVLGLLFVFLKDTKSFPNLWALVLVGVVAVLLIVPAPNSGSQWIGARLLVRLGDISYALYLWHWPIFVIIHREFGATISTSSVGIVLSLLVAVGTTRWIERPFYVSRIALIRVTPILGACLIVLVGAVWMGRSPWFYGMFPRAEAKESNFASLNECGWSTAQWQELCTFSDPERIRARLIVIGDSNARSASDGLVAAAATNDWAITLGVRAGCPAYVSTIQLDLDCTKLNKERFRFIESSRPDLVLIINHWWNYQRFSGFSDPTSWIGAMGETIYELDRLGIPVIVQNQIPICRSTNSLTRRVLRDLGWQNAYKCQMTPSQADYINTVVDGVGSVCRNNFMGACSISDVSVPLCGSRELCQMFSNNVNLFSDPTHISPSGSKLTADYYSAAIQSVLDRRRSTT